MSRPDLSGIPPQGEVEDLLKRLRAEILALEAKESIEEAPPLDDLIAAVKEADPLLASSVRRGIDQLLDPGEGLDPALRAKFLAAARRALKDRTDDPVPLPVFFERARLAENVAPAILGESLALNADDVLAFERGERRITELSPEIVAKWAQELRIPRDDLQVGLTAALRRLPREVSYAHWSHAGVELSSDDQRFTEQVLNHFDGAST